MYIHTFGCYFGLACSWAIFFKNKNADPFGHPHNYTTYNSDTFAMIGIYLSQHLVTSKELSSCGCSGLVSTLRLPMAALNTGPSLIRSSASLEVVV